MVPPAFMKIIVTNWVAVNIHTGAENESSAIIYNFQQLECADTACLSFLENNTQELQYYWVWRVRRTD